MRNPLLAAAVTALSFANVAPGARADADPGQGAGEVSVKVPESLINQGLILEAGDHQWPLTQSSIALTPRSEATSVRLLDSDGRWRAFAYLDLGADLFTKIYPHEWRISAYVGNTMINAAPMRSLLQNGSLDEEDFDLDWQPCAFGLRGGIAIQSSEERHSQIDSQYGMIAMRFAATYERANLLGRLHAMVYTGVFAANHHIELFDSIVSKTASANAFGPYGGLDLLYPLVNDIWLSLRASLSYQRVAFKAFDFKHNFVEHGTSIGVSYAF